MRTAIQVRNSDHELREYKDSDNGGAMKTSLEASRVAREPFTPGEQGLREKPAPFRNVLGRESKASVRPRPRAGVPDVPSHQRAVDDLVKRVRKLRWMGFEDEANRLRRLLHKRTAGGGGLTETRDTD